MLLPFIDYARLVRLRREIQFDVTEQLGLRFTPIAEETDVTLIHRSEDRLSYVG